jgi:hypothetical protein
MNQPPDNPIALRTRSQTKDDQPGANGRPNKNFARLNIDDREENNTDEKDIKKSPSLSMDLLKKNESQLLQESFTAELEKKTENYRRTRTTPAPTTNEYSRTDDE